MASESVASNVLAERLRTIVGSRYVLTDLTSRVFYSQDVFTRDLAAAIVVQPDSTQELAAVVEAAVAAGSAVIARGGGMSYTGGYVPVQINSVLIDTARMNRVLEINQEDMFVTVQVGCNWKALHEALKGSGLRTPFWGPLSGLQATVGGSVSQNSVFWGAGLFGASADSVVSMEVVLADGSVLATGSAAQRNGRPFFRHFGPDLTGLFTCDTGALGVKATITLRLLSALPACRHISYDFDNYPNQVKAMCEISRQNLVAQMFGTDPGLGQVRAQRDRLLNDVKALGGVMKSAGSVMAAVKKGAKIAWAGRRVVKNASYPIHANVEDHSEAGAIAAAQAVADICESFGGRVIENSIPSIVHANPFARLNNMVGPNGERWVPVHALLPHSKVIESVRVTEAIFAKYQDEIAQHNITTGFLFTTISTNCFFMEPLFFWPDALNELHRATVEKAVLSKQSGFAENLQAREWVATIRGELIQAFSVMGASHLQVGKEYIYKEALKSEPLALLQAIKRELDPSGCINPGSLGL